MKGKSATLKDSIGQLESEKQVILVSNSLYDSVGDYKEFISIVTYKTVKDANARVNEEVLATNQAMFKAMNLDAGTFNIDLDRGRALYTS
ncbi:MAG: hypothetical protein MK033_08665 [Candidatus Caenarcaniphilales bacterium]|nr:hypothetical protein [Candidatus Caenarcaniphilales bacterium]